MEQNKDIRQENVEEQKPEKKKINPAAFIVPGIIAVIIIVFAIVIYWAKVIKPKADINNELGYNTEEYIKLGQIKGLEAEISQEEWDECVNEDRQYHQEVDRAAKENDQIEFDFTGYINGKKVDDLTMKEQSLNIGENSDGIYKKFSDAFLGKKKGDKVSIEVSGKEVAELSMANKDYSDKKVKFQLKVRAVSELVVEKITDKWVVENYLEERGVETTDEFYEWEKEYLIETSVKQNLWKKVVQNAKMSGYPAELYNDTVDEIDGHIIADAKEQGMSVEEYKQFFGYTDEKLDEEYSSEVKSQLVMWQLVKDLGLEASAVEIEEMYEKEYAEVNLDSVEEMKKMYTVAEMKEAVLLEKAQQYVFDNAKVSYNYKIDK
ncbi:FKBP-type peptidyl-prolyl cis-trans isomerase [uncultured Eubacterium sp.]|uniref:FKBP-type peptidyl-prolyl cis-trans isomerase n=1 Tax=uncultured Eubacterium sp. TaxID=165185 RepID=UPI002672FD88|nr:FKBP-type peptidyl-prolyl cis-trans isomerase [uncultured Eubacterium sp.]